MTLRERWDAFSQRERVMIAGGAAFVLLFLAYRGLTGGDDEETSAGVSDARWVKHEKIKNYRRIASRAEAVAKQADQIDARKIAQNKRLMSGATPTQVGAELQGLLSGLAEDGGLNVLSSQVLREDEVEGYRRIGVRLTLSGPLDGVAKLMAGIEGGQYDLVIQTLDITRKITSRRPSTSTAPDDSPLTVSMEVRTFLPEGMS